MAKVTKKKVSERAAIARINRKLAHEGQQLMKCRVDTHSHGELGDYYIVDTRSNRIEATDQDLETLARELGVLRAFEVVE